jgi:hypothetical protein
MKKFEIKYLLLVLKLKLENISVFYLNRDLFYILKFDECNLYLYCNIEMQIHSFELTTIKYCISFNIYLLIFIRKPRNLKKFLRWILVDL